METVGTLIDKLSTVNHKTFLAQEIQHEVSRETFEQFEARVSTVEGRRALWAKLRKLSDLNAQRNNLITEVDARLVEMITAAACVGRDGLSGAYLEERVARALAPFVQQAHKTYGERQAEAHRPIEGGSILGGSDK